MNAHDPDPRRVTLSALARAIASTTEPAKVYTSIAEVAVRSLGAKVARVWINDSGAGVLRAAGSFGVQPEVETALLDATVLPHGQGVPGRVLGSRAAEFIEDAHDDPDWKNGRFIRELGLHGYAGLPLIAGDTVTGVLSVLFDRPRPFTKDDRSLAGWLADCVAIAVRVAQLYDERRRSDMQGAVISLANSVAHELNSPLTVVIGHLALVGDHTDPETASRIERAQAAAGRLAEIVRRLQQITRLEMLSHASSDLPPTLDIWRSSRD